jgi:predicted RNA binding protein YcfA (HicA-like mRNA interferase family)
VSKRDKLIARILRRPADADLSEVTRLLHGFGWELDGQEGSHITFSKPSERPITFSVVQGRKVKRIYLVQICDRLELDD